MPSLFRLDHQGIGEVLLSGEVASAVSALAENVASNARSAESVVRNGMDVTVRHETTDRARSVVAIAHPGGLAVQAKHGVLTQAASAAGLEVTAR